MSRIWFLFQLAQSAQEKYALSTSSWFSSFMPREQCGTSGVAGTNIVKFSEHFERKWDEILLNASSKEMRELVFSEVEIGIDLVPHEFWNWKGLL